MDELKKILGELQQAADPKDKIKYAQAKLTLTKIEKTGDLSEAIKREKNTHESKRRRVPGGKDVNYFTRDVVLEIAQKVFVGGYSLELKDGPKLAHSDGNIHVFVCTMRFTWGKIIREATGAHEAHGDFIRVLGMGLKSAETDATKRIFDTFGINAPEDHK